MERPRWEHVHVDEVPPMADQPFVEGQWRPVRAHLGISAFGTNAYVAGPGRVVIEEHDETGNVNSGGSQEELYFVHRGRALFTLDGEELEAPAGTYVFVRDARVVRRAVALDDDTAVLAFGAAPGRPFEVSLWESKYTSQAEGE